MASTVFAAEDDGNLIPDMTSNSAPLGVASASSVLVWNNTDYSAYLAFSSKSGNFSSSTNQAWLQYKFAQPTKVNRYSVSYKTFLNPESWRFQGSDDGTNFVTLHTVSSAKIKDAPNNTVSYSFTNEHAYLYYRVNVTAVQDNGTHFGISRMRFFYDIPIPTNLTAVGGNSFVDLNWTSVTQATYYSVSRSTDPGGPYGFIGSSPNNTFTDTDVTNGITYYYVVTAATSDGESVNSNEASATPIAPQNPNRSLLTIYISGGQIKEYDLSAAELSAFLNWYDAKDAGSGPAKYAFTKTWNKGLFKTRTEYVIFDKILTFEVDEYEIENP